LRDREKSQQVNGKNRRNISIWFGIIARYKQSKGSLLGVFFLKGGGLGAGVQVSAMGGHDYGSSTYMEHSSA